MKIYCVTISIPGEEPIDYFVRHMSSTQARSWVLNNRIDSHIATQSEIIRLVQDGYEIIGLEEESSDTQDLPLE